MKAARSGGVCKSLIAAVLALALLAVLGVPAALGVEEVEDPLHAYNQRLSLTGGCLTYPVDEVPDPDCPYPAPPAGPSKPFNTSRGIAVDDFGNVYVASAEAVEGTDGRIDVFDAHGHFLTEMAEPNRPRSIAVDSKGYLYVYSLHTGDAEERLRRYTPTVYDPAAGEIEYNPSGTLIAKHSSFLAALAVNPENDHLFVNFGNSPTLGTNTLVEYGSGEEGNPLVDSSVDSQGPIFHSPEGEGLAIDAAHGRLYASTNGPSVALVIRVFELAPPHNVIETIDGSTTPQGSFLSDRLSLAADEGTGNLFVYEQSLAKKIWELSEDGEYLATIDNGGLKGGEWHGVAVDNGASSPNGVLNDAEGRYLWATSAPNTTEAHAFAFGPSTEVEPTVESVSFSDVGEAEAELHAEVNPGQLETTFVFEYVSRAQFEASGFAGAQVAGEGTIKAGEFPVAISAEAAGLVPGTSYVFRVVATNELGSDEGSGTFATYPASSLGGPCPNDALRTGPSVLLPDCRAYELVTPPDTNARSPMGSTFIGTRFNSLTAAPEGGALSFRIEGGLIPGFDGSASLGGDPYRSDRGADGWSTVEVGGNSEEASAVQASGRSPDQGYSVWQADGIGTAVVGDDVTLYLHYPDGHSELLGQGSLGSDPAAQPRLITQGAGHVIFISSAHLEEAAAPAGKEAVYDRSPGGPTRVVSLLPGGATPTDSASYQGSSNDGRGVAFTVGGTLYLRVDNKVTYQVGSGLTFEGIAEGGRRVFYLNGAGVLQAFDPAHGFVTFANGNPTVVNVSADGSTAYFVSTAKLTSALNPLHEEAEAGKQNLYVSHEGQIGFVGIVTEGDVKGEGGEVKFNGLGLWLGAVRQEGGAAPGRFASDPSRATPDGGVLLFQSRAPLTAYDSEGQIEIYRYDYAADELACLSCNPTEAAPDAGGAVLQSVAQDVESPKPITAYDVVPNLSPDGRRALFQTSEPLVALDTDGHQDVYEWEAQGSGSCIQPGGCLYLLSSAHSAKDDYLFAADREGSNVFIWTSDLLVGADSDATPSIYDARIGGGFPESTSAECQGEACRPSLTPPPALPAPGSVPNSDPGNLSRSCPKGKRKVRRQGKVRCVTKKHKKKHHHRPATRKGAGK